MAKLNDETVIQYYQQKKQTLSEELQRIESLLGILSGKGAPAETQKKRKYTRRPQAKQATAATQKTAAPKLSRVPSAAPKKGLSWDDKVQQALGKIGAADKETIVQHIGAKDTASTEKIRKALTLRLAVMEKNGKLKKATSGDKVQYRLP